MCAHAERVGSWSNAWRHFPSAPSMLTLPRLSASAQRKTKRSARCELALVVATYAKGIELLSVRENNGQLPPGFAIRVPYRVRFRQQCMVFWNNHALLPKAYAPPGLRSV